MISRSHTWVFCTVVSNASSPVECIGRFLSLADCRREKSGSQPRQAQGLLMPVTAILKLVGRGARGPDSLWGVWATAEFAVAQPFPIGTKFANWIRYRAALGQGPVSPTPFCPGESMFPIGNDVPVFRVPWMTIALLTVLAGVW